MFDGAGFFQGALHNRLRGDADVSVPGSQSTSCPVMRARRARMSWMVLLRTWPSVSTPVTLGGGMAMEKAGFANADRR